MEREYFEIQSFAEKAKKKKFSIGAKIVGNDDTGRYVTTKKGWVGTIVGISENEIRVAGYNSEGDEVEYNVDPDLFDLLEDGAIAKEERDDSVSPEEIEEIDAPIVEKEKKETERKPYLPIEINESTGKVLILETELAMNSEATGERPLIPREEDFCHFTLDKRTLETIEKIATAVELKEPCLLEGETSTSKTSSIEYLAMVTKNEVLRLNLNGQTDTSELIGKFVPNDGQLQIEFEQMLEHPELLSETSLTILKKANAEGRGLMLVESQKIAQAECIKVPDWRWQDGIIPEGMKSGKWIILDEINLAEPQILERLNSVLEKNPSLTMSENSGAKIGKGGSFLTHPNFRIFATMNPAEYAGRQPMSPAYKDRWTSYKYVEVPSQTDYRAMMELMVYGEQPEVEIGGIKYKGESQKSLFPTLEATLNFRGFLAKLAKFHVTIEDLARRRVIGKNRKEKYIFTRRGLLEFFDYSENKTLIDRKTRKKISIKDNPKEILSRAIQYYYLDKITNLDDLKKITDQLDAIGISEDNWTLEFQEKITETKKEEKKSEEEAQDKAVEEKEEIIGRDAEKFLNEVFDWIKENTSWSSRGNWDWTVSKDGKFVNMSVGLSDTRRGSFPPKYLDKETGGLAFSGGESGTGIDDLLEKLRGKKIISINADDGWYLEIINAKKESAEKIEKEKSSEKLKEFNIGDEVLVLESSDLNAHRGQKGKVIEVNEKDLKIKVGGCEHVIPKKHVKKTT